MAIQIKVGETPKQEEKKPQRTIKLNAKKALNGDIMVKDHPEIHIVVSRKNNKIITYPKNEIGDHTYHSQDDLFSYLADYGVVSHDAMQGGVILGSMEATIMQPSEGSTVDPIEVVLSKLYDYFQMEEPTFEMIDKFEQNEEDRLMHPDVYTDLGDVPQAEKKGSIDPRFARRYYITYHF
jgi:hypothetical protein